MKKLNVILLIFSFNLSGIGGIFLFDAKSSNNDSIQTVAPSNKIESEEVTEYTYKTYEDYFTDYDFSNLTLTGNGTKESPFQVNSTEDFLWLIQGNKFADASEKRGVPKDYIEVCYLQSTGTQIIDTGVIVKNSIRPYIKFLSSSTYNSSGNVKNIFGGTDTTIPIAVSANFGDGNVSDLYRWHGNTYANGNVISSINSPHNVIHELEFKDRWWFDGVESSITQQHASGDSSNITIAFFGRNGDGTLYPFNIREYLNIYAFKLWDGEELIRDYVPCLRKGDNKPGMYDLVTNEFYTNQGEGEFLYGNYGQSGSNKLFAGCYIELNCDIYLNDEKFDENGNPSGGDGKVYSWSHCNISSVNTFDGKGHSIKGLYDNDVEHSKTGLLFANSITNAKNLNFENVYILGKDYVGVLANVVYNIENCHILSGYITATGARCGGIVPHLYKKAINCSNYATIRGTYDCAGLFGYAKDALLEGCKNFGKIIASGTNAGCLVGDGKNIIFVNCENYGTISSTTYHAGAICGTISSGYGKFINCKNYGSIKTVSVSGVILGWVYAKNVKVLLEGCENYGYVYNSKGNMLTSSYVGYIQDAPCTINLKNCYSNTKIQTYFANNLHFYDGDEKTIINIENCTMVQTADSSTKYLLFGRENYNRKVTYNIKNTIFDVRVKKYDYYFYPINYSSGYLNLNIENVYIKSNCEQLTTTNFIGSASHFTSNINGLVFDIKENGVQKGVYYGEDFGQYYYSWKTGTIGLIALDGRGQFQGAIDEEWLKNRGYQKKSV